MYMFDWLFGKKEHIQGVAQVPAAQNTPAPAAIPAATAPGTGIHFHPELVEKLSHEHRMLLKLFTQTQAAARQGDVVHAAQHAEAFRVLLQGHLLSENVRLYVYLEHSLAGDASSFALIRAFRHEMDGIGKAVMDFLGRYRDLAQRPDLAAQFLHELDGIGQVLAQRIAREEETLYPLYTA
jgi:regulator of sigma D